MKVLMTADTAGDVWTYALELIQALRAHGGEVLLATMGAPLRPDQWCQAQALDNLRVCEGRYPLEGMDQPWADGAAAGPWLLELASQWQPDLVHLNGYRHAALPFAAPVVVVAHSCVLSWWQAVHGVAAPAEWDEYRRQVGAGLAAADLVVAPSSWMLQTLERLYGQLHSTAIVHHGRAASAFRTGPKRSCIFSAGRLWDQAQNITALEQAAGHLPWPVYVAGDNEHPSSDAAPRQGVRYLGHLTREELASWYAQASIYALPARYEAWGLSVLEAALSNCALVLGDIPALRELWHGAACFVAPDDTMGLELAITTLVRDVGLRDQMAERAHRRATMYSATRMAAQYAALYRQLPARRPVPGPAAEPVPAPAGDAALLAEPPSR